MNQFAVEGGLDHEVASILAHPDYQPVQRMLRLIFHPDNRQDLPEFARNQMAAHSLRRVYAAAMSNDYLWINPNEDRPKDQLKTDLGEYGPSLLVLRTLMMEMGLLNKEGLLL